MKRLLTLLLAIMLCIPLLPSTALAANYTVPITSYDAFRAAVLGKGYDIDNAYGVQCYDGAGLIWRQLGRWLDSGGTGAAKGTWTVQAARIANAGTEFELITRKEDVKRGDIVVLNGPYNDGTWSISDPGHIGFADADYNPNSPYQRFLDQNFAGRKYFSEHNIIYNTFLGAFRLKAWHNSALVTGGPTISSITTQDNTVTLSWNAVANAIHYSVYVYTSSDSSSNQFVGRKLNASSTTSVTLARSELSIADAGGTYWFCIVAEGSGSNNYKFGPRKSAVLPAYTACDHAESQWTVTTPPTCTLDGEQTETCVKCGEVLSTKAVDSLGHDPFWDVVVEPGKYTPGYRELGCTRCNELLDSEEIPCTGELPCGHDISNVFAAFTVAVTCVSDGAKEYRCGQCGMLADTETFPALGHSAGQWTSVLPASCANPGVEQSLCEICGLTLQSREIPQLQHEWAWQTVQAATASQTGLKHYICKKCNAVSDTLVIELNPAETAFSRVETQNTTDTSVQLRGTVSKTYMTSAGYDIGTSPDSLTRYSEAVNTDVILMFYDLNSPGNNYKWGPSLQPGTTYYYRLWYKTSSATVTSALHSFTTTCSHPSAVWNTTAQSTCTANGQRTKQCPQCGKTVEIEYLPVAGHVYADKHSVIRPSTCIDAGLSGRLCVSCETAYADGRVLPPTNHRLQPAGSVTPADGAEDGYTFGVHCADCLNVFSIASVIEHDRVLTLPGDLTVIEEKALYNLDGIHQVVLPDGAVSIGPKAFADCGGLKAIIIPESVDSIADDAFDGCPAAIILCPADSYARSYAEEHGIPAAAN